MRYLTLNYLSKTTYEERGMRDPEGQAYGAGEGRRTPKGKPTGQARDESLPTLTFCGRKKIPHTEVCGGNT